MQKPLESLYMTISKRINRKTNLRFFRFYNAILKIEKVHRETGAFFSLMQAPPREPESSVPWRGRFLCSGYPLPAFVGLSYATKGGACWAIPGMQTARCAVSIVPDLKRWRPSAAYARAVSVRFTMTSLLIPRIHFLSSLMKLDQFQSGKHSDTPLLEQQQRTGRICSLHTIFVMHKKAIKRAFLMQISAKSLQKTPQSKTANGRLGGYPLPTPKATPLPSSADLHTGNF